MGVREEPVGDHAFGIIILGFVVLLLLLLLWAPTVIGTILMLFAPLVVVLGIIGLLRPSLMRLPNRLASVWLFALAFGMFLGGGMLISPQNGEGTASDAPMPVASSGAVFRSNGPIVTERTWTDGPWPFTEDAGTITCSRVSGTSAIIFVTEDGRRWPLNGVAKSNADQFGAEPSLDPIWRQNPDVPYLKVSVSPMINRGRETCRSNEQRRSAEAQRRRQPAPTSVDTTDIIILCHNYVQARVLMSGAGVELDFPAFMDGVRGAQHLGGTEYAFESYVDLVDGRESTRLYYHCRVEDGAVIAFMER